MEIIHLSQSHLHGSQQVAAETGLEMQPIMAPELAVPATIAEQACEALGAASSRSKRVKLLQRTVTVERL